MNSIFIKHYKLRLYKMVLLLPSVFFIVLTAHAQAPKTGIKGRVTDDSQTPLQGVTIQLNTSAKYATTDSLGDFSLLIPQGDCNVTFSYIGYKTLKKNIKVTGSNFINIGTVQLERERNFLSEVAVKSKITSQKIKNQGFQVNVLDLKKLHNTNANISDALNHTQGVRIREEGGLGSTFHFSLNGFSGNEVKFFLDGIPMDNFGSSLGINNIPINVADRVEVYKGVLPVHLGTDALGGAINIITRKSLNYLDVSYSAGSFNTHRPAVSAAVTGKNGLTLRTNLFYNYSDNNYKVWAPILNLDNSSFEGDRWARRFHDRYQSGTAQVEAGVTGKKYADHLLLGVILSENNKDIQTGVTMRTVFGALNSKSRSVIPTLKYKKNDFLLNGLDFNLYTAYNTNSFQLIDTVPRTYNWLGESVRKASAGSDDVGGENSRTQNENKNKEFLANASWVYKINSWQTLSLNDIYTNFKRTSFDVENPDVYTNRFPSKLFKNIVGLGWNANLYDIWTASVFAKYYYMKAVGYDNVGDIGQDRYEAVTFNYQQPGYGIATSYFIVPALQLKASYEHAYRMPESGEIFGDGVFVVYSPNLKPEKSDNINAGALYNVRINEDHRLSAEAGFILRYTKDYIRVDQSTSGANRSTVNQGKVRTTGIEGELSYNYKKWLTASVNATWQKIIDKEEFQENKGFGGGITRNFTYNFRLPNIPYLFANANVGVNIPVHKNTINFNYLFSFVEKYYLTFAEFGTKASNEEYVIPRQLSHNASVGYALAGGKYNISLECRNLTNDLLYDAYKLQKPGRSFNIKIRYFISKN
ncbi:MAG: TonB-dependent receptor [Niabella sp.]